MEDAIAGQLTRALALQLTGEQHRQFNKRSTHNVAAYQDYLQGRYLYLNKRTQENMEKAIAHFHSAIKADPAYAQPYAGIAGCYNQLGRVNITARPPLEAWRLAAEFVGKALAIASELAEAHVALGYVRSRNREWAAAEAEFKRALELNPN
ncbi:MAG: tetratricopeptide repeat protein [Blastocatellia bacterium]